MKQLLTILFFALSISVSAQSKRTIQVLANARSFEQAVFVTKDSAALEKLFAKTLSYGHPDGRIESRAEAIRSIMNNRSEYSYRNSPSGYNVKESGDSMVVVHVYSTTEKKTDGAQSVLDLSIETVWAKEKGEWRLFRCQAIKL